MAYDGYLNQLRAKNYANYRKFNSTDITLNGPNSFTCLPGGNTPSNCYPPQNALPSITLNSPAERVGYPIRELPIYPNPNHIQFNGETSFTVLSHPTSKNSSAIPVLNSVLPPSLINKHSHYGNIEPVVGNQSGMVYNIGNMPLDSGLYHIYYTISFQLKSDIDIVRIMYGINNEPDFEETAPNDIPCGLSLESGVCLNYTGSQLIRLDKPTHIFLNGGLCFESSSLNNQTSLKHHCTNGSEYKIDGTLVAIHA
jgi:hypothetical protein